MTTQATAYPLTEEQVRFYQENGFVQLRDVLTDEELAQARTALAEVLAMQLDAQHDMTGNAEYRKVFVQKVNLWRVHEGFKKYVFSHKLAEIARRLTHAKQVRLWHDQALVKMPGDSKASPWHQDLPYWPMQETDALSCWMALDDVYEANGCMAFVPGSQKLGRLEPINLTNPQDLFALASPDKKVPFNPILQPMSAGSCTFHNGMTFHYAGPNTTDKPRRAIVTIYMPDTVHFTGANHIVTGNLGLRASDVLEGERFPVLAQEEAV
jgi:ectoine hydroxylase-related dioxygenase (phytanoyl-CoA dioxygenase family)